MADSKALIQEVLDTGYLMSLGTVDDGGPWVSDVVYVADDTWTLYWLSQTTTRHSQAILKNPAVAASITISNNQGEDNRGLQLEGISDAKAFPITDILRMIETGEISDGPSIATLMRALLHLKLLLGANFKADAVDGLD